MSNTFGYTDETLPTVESVQLDEGKVDDTLEPAVIMTLRLLDTDHPHTYGMPVLLAELLGHELRLWASNAQLRDWDPPTREDFPDLNIAEELLTDGPAAAAITIRAADDPTQTAIDVAAYLAVLVKVMCDRINQDPLTILDAVRDERQRPSH